MDDFDCPVCLDRFIIPKLLTCGHSVCLKCCKALIRSSIAECPECRMKIQFPKSRNAEHLNTNWSLLKLLESNTNSIAGAEVHKCVEVHYPYQPEEPDELELVVGDVIEVIHEQGEWMLGKIGAKTGLFPSAFVTPVPQAGSSSVAERTWVPPESPKTPTSFLDANVFGNTKSSSAHPLPSQQQAASTHQIRQNRKVSRDLSNEKWFRTTCTRATAERELKDIGINGCFLIRPKSDSNADTPYALSLFLDGNIHHVAIRRKPNGRFCGGVAVTADFESVTSLVNFYMTNQMKLNTVGGKSVRLRMSTY